MGIVGRTGAGKSSLLQALFRFVLFFRTYISTLLTAYFSAVNPRSGKIEIDGYNIRDIGLDVLRHRLALVPQDSTLFLGTLRENM